MKKNKRFLSLALALILMLALVPMTATFGAEEEVDGFDKEARTFTFGHTVDFGLGPSQFNFIRITNVNEVKYDEATSFDFNAGLNIITSAPTTIIRLGGLFHGIYNEDGELDIVDVDGVYTITEPGYYSVWVSHSRDFILPIHVVGDAPAPAPAVPVAPVTPAITREPATARPSESRDIVVNGETITFDAYLIGGSNYIKLRDLAHVLNGTEKQFCVGWDGENDAISLTSRTPYTTPNGTEMQPPGTANKTATPTSSRIFVDGEEVQFTAYLIEGNNYFRLRDVMRTFDVYVGWDAEAGVASLDTTRGYED
jgi:hypothetical protein